MVSRFKQYHRNWLIAGLVMIIGSGLGCNTASLPMGDRNGAAYDFSGEPAAAPAPEQQLLRDIEEADIVKVVGDKLYALNLYKGLLIIDVTNPDAPALLGHLDLNGRGVEMYVVDTRVLVLLSADYYYPVMMGAASAEVFNGRPVPPAPDFVGSQLAVVNVTDPAAPTLQGKMNLVGYASESRRVGNIIYVIGSNYVPYVYGDTSSSSVDEGFVASVSIADPTNPVPVQRKTFSGNALVMHASQAALYVASQQYDYQQGGTATHIQVVDISDPAGAIALRGSVDVPGTIRNRFYLDAYENALRVVTDSWGFGYRSVRVYSYSIADLDQIVALGQAEIMKGESLEAVRFDGPRGYAVTFFRTDPLFVLNLQDPANPVVSGSLEVPGFSTHIEPRGNRLIAIGIDDTDGRRPAVAYYSVEDPTNPSELGRVILGPPGSFTESEAVYDEKAFKVVDELGLIAIPFKHVDWSTVPGPEPVPFDGSGSAERVMADSPSRPGCLNAVQLVDFSDSGLAQRGYFEHHGQVQRVGVIGARVFALSQASFQTVNITDRDNPTPAGTIDFFSTEDMPYYADDCYGGPSWPPFEMPADDGGPWSALIQVFLNGDYCGTISVLPAAILPLGMFFMRYTNRRR